MKTLSPLSVRNASRFIHLVGAAWIGTFVYSPWGDAFAFRFATRFAVIPLLVLTGLVLWKQKQLRNVVRSFGCRSEVGGAS